MTNRLLLPVKAKGLGGAEFRVAAIEEAIDFLEIDRPVEIKWSAGLRRVGCHRVRDGRHLITICTYSSPAEASRTLWHELAHAAQADSTPDFARAYRRDREVNGYRGSHFETEAREVAEVYGAEMSLTK